MNTVTWVQILYEIVCISHCANRKNPVILSLAMGKQFGRLGSLTLVWQPVLKKENWIIKSWLYTHLYTCDMTTWLVHTSLHSDVVDPMLWLSQFYRFKLKLHKTQRWYIKRKENKTLKDTTYKLCLMLTWCHILLIQRNWVNIYICIDTCYTYMYAHLYIIVMTCG